MYKLIWSPTACQCQDGPVLDTLTDQSPVFSSVEKQNDALMVQLLINDKFIILVVITNYKSVFNKNHRMIDIDN